MFSIEFFFLLYNLFSVTWHNSYGSYMMDLKSMVQLSVFKNKTITADLSEEKH